MTESNEEIRLLMVDDEREFLRAMKPGLVRRGFDVTLAESGSAALELVSTRTFDVVVLDVKMPGISGVEAFQEIKRLDPELPVILLTGHGNIEQAFESSRDGVFEYLTKPCDVEELSRVAREAAVRGARGARGPERTTPGTTAKEEIRLLLVDDDRDFVTSLKTALERRGVTVAEAYDGHYAIESVRANEFHVAVVDVRMPGMDGLTLLERLREIDPLLQVIILSGHPSVSDVRRGLQEGAFDYLTKPQRVEDLFDRILEAWDRWKRCKKEKLRKEMERILEERPE
jgi:DNA-binding NtrC family response regulator